MDQTTSTGLSRALTPAESAAYLARIGTLAIEAPTLGALASLHRAHLLAVPFENLDIARGRPIRLDTTSLLRKVVTDRRGGYCYELNGLFAALLRSLGYAVSLASARVAGSDGRLSPEYDHLALIVGSPLLDERQLVDVGFGDAFLEPLPMVDGFSRVEGAKRVGLVTRDAGEEVGEWTYREDAGDGWHPTYVFTTTPHVLEDFAARNEWQQTSPESHFTQKRVASVATPTGRVTLSGERLITTTASGRTERELDPSEVAAALDEHFGIVLR
ncbi:acetyltransferase [Intrasporangium oryzae NRRL B-24470]|uniref:Acetyltransferase n=1 Tax=Intrasporangium oryzae NRRL B-24470 TaxID=1386089 RepID=W9GEQ9_9MICO|nr:arylamine N-acetyltransferase [Intrasporangium oryzae]EWT03318.1 acetyltransferase [Intrasporangium oryzae NRRL B-24470]